MVSLLLPLVCESALTDHCTALATPRVVLPEWRKCVNLRPLSDPTAPDDHDMYLLPLLTAR